MTTAGKYVFVANTGSHTISRLVGTGNNVFVDDPMAAPSPAAASPADIDANAGVLGVIDHIAGQSHLSLFQYNAVRRADGRGDTDHDRRAECERRRDPLAAR